MLQKIQESAQGIQLKASGAWTVENAANIWRTLQPMLGQNIALDLAEVERLDSAGFQLLLQIKRNAVSSGTTVRFLNHSRPVLKTLDVAGVLGSLRDVIRVSTATKESLLLTYSRNKYSIMGGKHP
ncbi:MAG: STAS domain-containing protein [Leptospiraceae bacterium]|nr:STAS domain-containing protein [Leptospiraceae bacterium]